MIALQEPGHGNSNSNNDQGTSQSIFLTLTVPVLHHAKCVTVEEDGQASNETERFCNNCLTYI